MKAKIIINGIEKEIELTDEQAIELGLFKTYKPKIGETYFYVADIGVISSNVATGNIKDNTRYSLGNYYKTKKEAEFELLRKLFASDYKQYLEKYSEFIDWQDRTQTKWYAYYDYASNKIDFNRAYVCKMQGALYATSEEIIKRFIEKIGEENFKIYILKVEEK